MTEPSAKIDYVELPAPALSETKAFYAAVFGWSFADYGPTYAAYEGADVQVGLSTAAATGPAHEPGAESSVGPLVLFSTDDLEAVRAAVSAAGGQITSGPYGYPGGRRFHFRDPSGNILGVYQSDPSS